MYHILIIEDDPDIRAELKLLLENALYAVEALEDFTQLPSRVEACAPDLILLDIQLPNIDGLKVCQELRRTMDTPIIFVTGRMDAMDELTGILMGGDDYITKPYHAPILLARIAAVLKRTVRCSAGAAHCAPSASSDYQFAWKGCELDMLRSTLSHREHSISLTRNELRICYHLFSKGGQIVSREELIDDLWDNQIFIDDNTLSVHITRIRNKLKEIGVDNLIETRRGQGYRL